MTKRRDPLSPQMALTRIAGQLGYPAMADVVGKSERLIYDWADPDKACPISLADAIRLDVAHEAAGGQGNPLLETFVAALRSARVDAFADEAVLLDGTQAVVRECSDAVEALIVASRPGASRQAWHEAAVEVEQAKLTLAAVEPLLARRNRPEGKPP